MPIVFTKSSSTQLPHLHCNLFNFALIFNVFLLTFCLSIGFPYLNGCPVGGVPRWVTFCGLLRCIPIFVLILARLGKEPPFSFRYILLNSIPIVWHFYGIYLFCSIWDRLKINDEKSCNYCDGTLMVLAITGFFLILFYELIVGYRFARERFANGPFWKQFWEMITVEGNTPPIYDY
ncbi:unnamed protein product, partial [Mesorhabditis belari]|uniref:Uncharacterized protein n=1 Tax=Mesorhabditis belari TaxID=2138241 RepID=A0AAF3EKN4_9BILA